MNSVRMMSTKFANILRTGELHDNTVEKVFSIMLNVHDAEVQYSRKGDVYDLVYTNIPEQFQGHGLGTILAERVFDHLVEKKKKIKITCEFLQHFYAKNKDKYKKFVVED